MTFAPTGHRVIWLVWFLVFLGMLLGVVTLGLTRYTLFELQINNMFAMEAGALQKEMDDALDHFGMQAVKQIETTLEKFIDNPPEPDPFHTYLQVLNKRLDEYPTGDIHEILSRMVQTGQRLQALDGKVREWAHRSRPFLEDLETQQTITAAREQIRILRSDIQTWEKKERLTQSAAYRKEQQAAPSDEVEISSDNLGNRIRQAALGVSIIQTELGNLSVLLETLYGERHLERLVALKDTHIQKGLNRLSMGMSMLTGESSTSNGTIQKFLQDLGAIFFGEGYL